VEGARARQLEQLYALCKNPHLPKEESQEWSLTLAQTRTHTNAFFFFFIFFYFFTLAHIYLRVCKEKDTHIHICTHTSAHTHTHTPTHSHTHTHSTRLFTILSFLLRTAFVDEDESDDEVGASSLLPSSYPSPSPLPSPSPFPPPSPSPSQDEDEGEERTKWPLSERVRERAADRFFALITELLPSTSKARPTEESKEEGKEGKEGKAKTVKAVVAESKEVDPWSLRLSSYLTQLLADGATLVTPLPEGGLEVNISSSSTICAVFVSSSSSLCFAFFFTFRLKSHFCLTPF
jgi:hypothetical protein